MGDSLFPAAVPGTVWPLDLDAAQARPLTSDVDREDLVALLEELATT